MISHLRALALIQSIRCAAGLAIGAFLIWRSFVIPDVRASRLEPGDRTVFLAAGAAFAVLATLRGIQGTSTIRALRRSGERKGLSPLRIIILGFSGLVWAAAGLGTLAGIIDYFLISPGTSPEEVSLKISVWLLPWICAAVFSISLTIIAIASFFLRLRGSRLRRLGIAMAIVDLVDLIGFPFTTACGTYGLLVHRHPDALDFFEGVFSRREEAVQAGTASRAA